MGYGSGVVKMGSLVFATAVCVFAVSGVGRGEQSATSQQTCPNDPAGAVESPLPDSAAPGVKVELVLDKEEYYLGENILLHWGLTNAGDKAFTIHMGGDGRTPLAQRPLRFKVVATDSRGKQVEDPFPSTNNMGGWGGDREVKAGQSFWQSLALMRFCDFEMPGLYRVMVYHDLGWDGDRRANLFTNALPQGPHVAPIAETTIKLVMPTEAQARQVVEDMLGLPDSPNSRLGERTRPYADLTVLRQPVYLPIAAELARRYDPRGVKIVGGIYTPEATRELIELVHKNDSSANEAMKLLLERLPDPNFDKHAYWATQRRWSVRSWRSELAPAALDIGWKRLVRDDRQSLLDGAGILRCLGRKEDFPELVRVLDRVLVQMKDDPVEQQAYPRPRNACGALIDAGCELISRGAEPPERPDSPGQGALFMKAIGIREDFRPVGWQAAAAELLRHPIAYLRAITLENLPLPLDAAFIGRVAELIRDDSLPVQAAACDLAGKVKSVQFCEPLKDVLRKAEDEWIVESAHRAAIACGVCRDLLLEICIHRLDEPGMHLVMFDRIIEAVDHRGGWGYGHQNWENVGELKRKWEIFLDTHRNRIRDGVLFTPAQAPLTSDLFPEGFHFSPPGQSDWPP